MAVAPAYNVPLRTTLSATPDVATRHDFAQNTRVVDVAFYDASGGGLSGKYALTGTDGQAIPATFKIVPAGQCVRIPVSNGRARQLGTTSIYFASATASAVCEVVGLTSEGD